MPLRSVLLGAVAVLCLAGCFTADVRLEGESQSRPFGGSPHAIPGMIEAEHFDEGEPGKAYQDRDPKNHGVAYRDGIEVDIEKRPDASNGHGIGWVEPGEWVVYTVDVKKAGRYVVEIPVASEKLGGTFHLEMGGQPVTEIIQVPTTGSWKVLNTIRVETLPLQKGVQRLKVVMDSRGETRWVADIDLFRFSPVDA